MEQVTPWSQTFPCPCLEVQLWFPLCKEGKAQGPSPEVCRGMGTGLGAWTLFWPWMELGCSWGWLPLSHPLPRDLLLGWQPGLSPGFYKIHILQTPVQTQC